MMILRDAMGDTIKGYDLRDTIRFEGYDSILRDTILRDTKIVSPGSVEGYDPSYPSDFHMSGPASNVYEIIFLKVCKRQKVQKLSS